MPVELHRRWVHRFERCGDARPRRHPQIGVLVVEAHEDRDEGAVERPEDEGRCYRRAADRGHPGTFPIKQAIEPAGLDLTLRVEVRDGRLAGRAS